MSTDLLNLLQLQRRARGVAGEAELRFVIVNETYRLVPYRQAVLWDERSGITAVSGVATADPSAPLLQWLDRVGRRLAVAMTEPGPIDRAMLDPADRDAWADWLPAAALWLPLPLGARKPKIGLLVARDEPFGETELQLLLELADAYAFVLDRFVVGRMFGGAGGRRRLRRGLWPLAGVAVIAASFVPVPLTVLAPTDVVPAHPAVIRSPSDGVVDRVLVRPNERVVPGQPLFALDETVLKGKLEVAGKALATAEAELRELSQQAVFDPGAKSKLALALGRRDEQAAELANLQRLQERIVVKAPQSGITVLSDPSDWIGRPVAVGEKVLELAEEHDTEIEAWLAPGDAIDLPPNAGLTVFLNVAPLSPITATVRSVAYEATARPDGTFAHRVRARIDDGEEKPRLGLKGVSRLAGQPVRLGYWLLRRPIAALRAWAGL
ncbi:HlyD family efflux transporter periplasmic adaptor subunit [Siculibacillus lacustris]|uniref:HlyD family efflux transporter periplasmic adaptor subunit n=1 Tax=Siculibacillus lacustris TaxID=1549641 RepID=A0A4Q9VEG4_9HYPH|nr:HlyD family efflux transporter periplasmic adaptor subunit [Siculibacillus lacustris]TBW32368.1 HlyD family efflux transporter periplasmic adaptor subunit [Siculibacillus lacustris]